MSKCKCFGEHGGKNHTGKGQLSLSLSTRGWGRERGVTTSSLFGVGPSISRSASVFLNNLDHNHDTITIDITTSQSPSLTYACYSCRPPAVAALCSNRPRARRPCTPGIWILWKISMCDSVWINISFHLLTRNVSTLDTGSLVRAPCLRLITNSKLEISGIH